MSDGPHKSLPMRSGWKKVARFSNNSAFTLAEIKAALISALDSDCRCDVKPGFINRLVQAFEEYGASLFPDRLMSKLEGLEKKAGSGVGRTILDFAAEAAAHGRTKMSDLEDAVADALTDHATRGSRQVEEHICRKTSSSQGQEVGRRIDEAIHSAPIKVLAQRLIKREENSVSEISNSKQMDLDDGVALP